MEDIELEVNRFGFVEETHFSCSKVGIDVVGHRCKIDQRAVLRLQYGVVSLALFDVDYTQRRIEVNRNMVDHEPNGRDCLHTIFPVCFGDLCVDYLTVLVQQD